MSNKDWYAIYVLVACFAVIIAIGGAYEAGKQDGHDEACSTGKVYALDYGTVRIAMRTLDVAGRKETSLNERLYLIDQAQRALTTVGNEGPLQVECS